MEKVKAIFKKSAIIAILGIFVSIMPASVYALPNAPTLTSPTGGEIIENEHTITWSENLQNQNFSDTVTDAYDEYYTEFTPIADCGLHIEIDAYYGMDITFVIGTSLGADNVWSYELPAETWLLDYTKVIGITKGQTYYATVTASCGLVHIFDCYAGGNYLFTVSFTATELVTYTLQYTSNLSSNTGWIDIQTGIPSGTTSYIWDTSLLTSGNDYGVRIKAVDNDGYSSSWSTSGPFAIQHYSVPPSHPDLLPVSDTGDANYDNLTKLDNSSPANALQFQVNNTITGATVTLYADGTSIGSTVAGGTSTIITTNGSYDLTDGGHGITSRQTEPGKVESGDSPSLNVTIDTIAPVVTVDPLTTGDPTPLLTGTVNDNSAVITVTVDGNPYGATNNGDGTWLLPDNTITPPLSEGTYDVSAVATDTAGNVGSDTTIDELTIEGCGFLMVYGFAPGSPNDSNTTGGEVVTFVGDGFMTGMSVIFAAPAHEVTADPNYVVANSDGNELTIVVPAFPPGCDCAYQAEMNEPILVNVLFENECGQTNLFHGIGELFQYDIVVEFVTNTSGVQAAIDDANAGTCIVLEADKNYAGPLLFDSTKSMITLTSQDINDPGRTQVDGDNYVTPTVTFDGCGEGICISGLNFILGNCGAEIRNAAAPVIKACNFDDNIADNNRGGAITIKTAANPIIYDCLLAVNYTDGSGGGIRIEGASGTIVGNTIMGNTATDSGGGLFLKDTSAELVIADNKIWMNNYDLVPQQGGGVCWTGGTQYEPATGLLLRNDIWSNKAAGAGAGIFIDINVAPIIVQNMIRENDGLTENSYGGGIYVEEYNRNIFPICGNIIFGNQAQVGGALALTKKNKVLVQHNLIFCNHAVQNYEPPPPPPDPPPPPPFYAAGIYVKDAAPMILHNTIYNNTEAGGTGMTPGDQSGGIHGEALATGTPKFWDNILLDNEGWEVYSDIPLSGNKVDWNLAYDVTNPSTIFSPFTNPGANCIIADPLLNGPVCDPTDPWWAFGLQAGSLGICNASDNCDRGVVLLPDCPDCEPVSCLPADPNDCNGNGIPDRVDFLMGTSLDLNWNEVPDECDSIPGDLDRNGSVDYFDFAIFSLAWLTGPGDATWNPDCDISIPAGYFIDMLDFAVFAENWLKKSD